jgi:hypothetical protein
MPVYNISNNVIKLVINGKTLLKVYFHLESKHAH